MEATEITRLAEAIRHGEIKSVPSLTDPEQVLLARRLVALVLGWYGSADAKVDEAHRERVKAAAETAMAAMRELATLVFALDDASQDPEGGA